MTDTTQTNEEPLEKSKIESQIDVLPPEFLKAIGRMDLRALGTGIERFSIAFDEIRANVEQLMARTDALLHNERLMYSLLIEVNERIKGAAAGRPLEEIEERVRRARGSA